MEKNSSDLKQENVCQRLFNVIRYTTPFRTARFGSQEHREDAAIATVTSPNVSLMKPSPLNDRCRRVSKHSVSSLDHKKKYSESVGVTSATAVKLSPLSQRTKQPAKPRVTANHQPQEKPISLPIHGQENRIPSIRDTGLLNPVPESLNGMFSEYIDRAGNVIRSPTFSRQKTSNKGDSFNDKVSEFIHKTRHRLHNMPSFVESGKSVGYKEMYGKGKRDK